MTYEEATQLFKSKGSPGANGAAPFSNAWNDAYNRWMGEAADRAGVSDWYGGGLTPEMFNQPVAPTAPATPTLPNTSGGPTVPSNTGGLTSPGTPSPSPGWNLPVNNLPTPSLNQAPLPSATGNYSQIQNALQSGQFGTSGQSINQQQGQTGQTSSQDQTTTINQDQRTQAVTQALDTLGFGKALQGQMGSAQATDSTRNNWLLDTMLTGGSGFQSQLDQGVRNALTGPQMTGAGDSARARAAGYAGAEIGRRNLDQRLGAAGQLAGPTALTTLSTAANPFIGQSTSSNTNTSGTNRTTGTTNTTGWQDIMTRGAESQAGSTQAQSSQAGAGNIPQGQPVKTGGCVLCTAATELGYWNNQRVLRKVIAYKLGPGWKKFRLAARGYFAVFGPFADYLLDRPKLAKVLYPLARMVVYEELRQAGRKLPFKLAPWVVHWTGDAFCRLVGLLPVSGYVKEQRILNIAHKHNILFPVEA